MQAVTNDINPGGAEALVPQLLQGVLVPAQELRVGRGTRNSAPGLGGADEGPVGAHRRPGQDQAESQLRAASAKLG